MELSCKLSIYVLAREFLSIGYSPHRGVVPDKSQNPIANLGVRFIGGQFPNQRSNHLSLTLPVFFCVGN